MSAVRFVSAGLACALMVGACSTDTSDSDVVAADPSTTASVDSTQATPSTDDDPAPSLVVTTAPGAESTAGSDETASTATSAQDSADVPGDADTGTDSGTDADPAGSDADSVGDTPERLLIFTRTAGFRHASIGAGVKAMTELAASAGIEVTSSEDPSLFTDDSLEQFSAVVFLSTSGDILNRDQQAAFERFVSSGGGYLGVHAASDTEYDWPWYGRLVGAWFSDHPLVDNFVDCHCFDAELSVAGQHPSTRHLDSPWSRRDEWYNFRSRPDGVQVLLTVDEATYTGGTMGPDHPITWSHENLGGRSWYTAMGHTAESFAEPDFRQHLLGGLLWVLGDG